MLTKSSTNHLFDTHTYLYIYIYTYICIVRIYIYIYIFIYESIIMNKYESFLRKIIIVLKSNLVDE